MESKDFNIGFSDSIRFDSISYNADVDTKRAIYDWTVATGHWFYSYASWLLAVASCQLPVPNCHICRTIQLHVSYVNIAAIFARLCDKNSVNGQMVWASLPIKIQSNFADDSIIGKMLESFMYPCDFLHDGIH